MANNVNPVIWFGGEVTEGASVEPGLYTTALENIYMDEQKQPNLKFSTELIASLDIKNAGKLKGTFIGVEHAISAYQSDASTIILVIFKYDAQLYVKLTVKTTFIHDVISFYEVPREYFNPNINPETKNGTVCVLVSGMDKMYYINGVNIYDFKIMTFSFDTTGSVDIIKPIGSTFIQSRFVVICDGPKITASGENSNPHRVLFSRITAMDNFTTNSEGAYISFNAIDAILLCSADERFLAITALTNVVVITTTIGLRIVSSGLVNDTIITSGNIGTYITSYGECIASPAFGFSSFLVFATKRTLRAKNLQLAESTERESVDMELPLLTSMDDDIINISFNSGTQTIDCFLSDGTVRSLFFQSVIPSGSYPLSLPTTTTHKHPLIKWHATKNKISIASVGDQLCLLKENQEYGILIEGAKSVTWPIRLSNKKERSFDVTFINIIPTENITGLWLKLPDKWCFCVRENSVDSSYNTEAEIDLSGLQDLQECIVHVRDEAYEIFPEPFNKNLFAVGQIDCEDETINHSQFFNNPVRSFGFNPNDTSIVSDLRCIIALGSLESKIGWRDVSSLVGPQKSHSCVLVSKYPELIDHVNFYDIGLNSIYQRYQDHGLVHFTSPKDIGYSQIEITASPKNILPTSKRHKYLRLLSS